MQERTPGALFRALVGGAVEPGLAHDASEEVRDRAGENIMAAVQASEERIRVQTEARFGQIDTRFGQIDARFSQIDARFGQIDAHFVQIDTRFSQIDTRFGQIDTRFGQIDARFGRMEARIDVLTEMIQSTQREISTLRWMIGIGFTLLALFIALAKIIGD